MELSIELKRDGISRTAVKVLAQFAKNDIDPFIAEQVNDGWTVESWIIKDSLPIDDGFLAAKAGKSADANPYAAHFWKHAEWKAGWDLFHEND